MTSIKNLLYAEVRTPDFVCFTSAQTVLHRGTWDECERAYSRAQEPRGGVVYLTTTNRLKAYLRRLATGREACTNRMLILKSRPIAAGNATGRCSASPARPESVPLTPDPRSAG
jgi:hypothetical protein